MFLCTQPRGFRPGSTEGKPRAPLSVLQTVAGKTPTAPVDGRPGVGLAFLSRHAGPFSLLHGVGRMGPAAWAAGEDVLHSPASVTETSCRKQRPRANRGPKGVPTEIQWGPTEKEIRNKISATNHRLSPAGGQVPLSSRFLPSGPSSG